MLQSPKIAETIKANRPQKMKSSWILRDTVLSLTLLLAFGIFAAFFNYLCSDFCSMSIRLRVLNNYKNNYYNYNNNFFTNRTIVSSAANDTRRIDNPRLPLAGIGEEKGKVGGCDLFSGTWVRDYTRPLYEELDCPWAWWTCVQHGRPDKDYLYWRWQPHGCSIPRFNATLMLEALRGKKMMFIGDSLSRGHFISLTCLLQRDIAKEAKSFKAIGSGFVFKAKEYNVTIEHYWAPLLLESNADNLRNRQDRAYFRGTSIDKKGQNWVGADIFVFNTYFWWKIKGLKMLLAGSFEDEVKHTREVGVEEGYTMGMKALVQWLDKNVKIERERVFFTTMSPVHQKRDWDENPNGNCYNETTPIQDPNYAVNDQNLMHITVEELGKSKVPITFLNITKLSSYRKDAHSSIYMKQWLHLTPEHRANPRSYADCTHWCLPGVQDTWNELLFARLLFYH